MPLEFQIPPLDIQNANVKLLEGASTDGLPGGPIAPYHSNKLIQTDQPFKVVFGWDQVAGSWMLNGGTGISTFTWSRWARAKRRRAGGHFTDERTR